MKVLAVKKDNKYLCEVGQIELEKFLNKYYGNLGRLSEGEEIDLGKGYDFMIDTKEALKKTSEFIESNKKIIKTMLDGITLLDDERSKG